MHRFRIGDTCGVAKTTGNPPPAGIACRIEITPTPEEFRQLCRDLDGLRGGEFCTNTALILQAVRLLAEGRLTSTP